MIETIHVSGVRTRDGHHRPSTASRSAGPLAAQVAMMRAVAVVTTIALAAIAAPNPARAAEATVGLDRDRLGAATVLITTDSHDPTRAGWGSGSIIDEEGLVLTNAHVAANWAPGLTLLYPDIRYQPPSPERLYVYTVDDIQDRATPTYQAEVVAVDGYLDLAVLRLVARDDGAPIEPVDLDLVPVPLGSAADLRPLDVLYVAGYPSLSETFAVTLSSGEINAFSDDARVGPSAWIHTDAKISPGNSGGAGVDASGRLVGIPTQSNTDDYDRAVDYIMRPVELALPLIEAAREGQPYDGYRYLEHPSGSQRARVVGWTSEPTDTCGAGAFGLPSGTGAVYPQVGFEGMSSGDSVLVELVETARRNDADLIRDYSPLEWQLEWGPDACRVLEMGFDRSFPNGDYEVRVRVGLGPADEFEITEDARRTAVTVGAPATFAPPDRNPRPSPATTGGLQARPQVEQQLLRLAKDGLGLSCKKYRAHVTNDPFDYDATGAILCDETTDGDIEDQGVNQFALFRFPDADSMADYWRYRVGEFRGRMLQGGTACKDGTGGIRTWHYARVACYVSTSSAGTRAARIRWTDKRTNTYGVLDATGVDLTGLFEWWLDHQL